jgi:excisionase family DNA binding protein
MTDMEAIVAAARTVWSLAREFVFPGGEELLKECPELTLEGGAFRIAFRLQQDLVDRNRNLERTMIALRFMPPGQRVSECPPTLYVRGHWAERTDQFSRVGPLCAKKLRKAFSPKRRPENDPHVGELLSDDLYLMENLPPDDLTAQICLFAIQTERSDDPELNVWLENYIVRTFTLRPLSARTDIARDIIVRLISNKWWAEDPKAWRKYIARVRGGVARSYRQLGTFDCHTAAGKVRASGIHGAPTLPPDLGGNFLTVDEARRRFNVKPSTLYSWIHARRIAVKSGCGRFLIPTTEIERLVVSPKVKSAVMAVAAARPCSLATARRFVSRLRRDRGVSLDDILSQYGEQGAAVRS